MDRKGKKIQNTQGRKELSPRPEMGGGNPHVQGAFPSQRGGRRDKPRKKKGEAVSYLAWLKRKGRGPVVILRREKRKGRKEKFPFYPFAVRKKRIEKGGKKERKPSGHTRRWCRGKERDFSLVGSKGRKKTLTETREGLKATVVPTEGRKGHPYRGRSENGGKKRLV